MKEQATCLTWLRGLSSLKWRKVSLFLEMTKFPSYPIICLYSLCVSTVYMNCFFWFWQICPQMNPLNARSPAKQIQPSHLWGQRNSGAPGMVPYSWCTWKGLSSFQPHVANKRKSEWASSLSAHTKESFKEWKGRQDVKLNHCSTYWWYRYLSTLIFLQTPPPPLHFKRLLFWIKFHWRAGQFKTSARMYFMCGDCI